MYSTYLLIGGWIVGSPSHSLILPSRRGSVNATCMSP